jgi:galactitol-specific phosphotransferase system IIB component
VGRPKRVLIVCGTGIATSTVVAQKVKEYCETQGIEVVVDQGKVMDILRGADDYDLVVHVEWLSRLSSAFETPELARHLLESTSAEQACHHLQAAVEGRSSSGTTGNQQA